MVMVRRQKESHAGFSVNALGFAGYMLATDESDMNWLTSAGGDALLDQVSGLAGGIAFNLLLQRGNRSIGSRQLAFDSITPTFEHVELALLVSGMGAVTRFRPAATRERKHGKLVPTRPF